MKQIPVDRDVVTRVVGHFRDSGRPGLKIDRWPEDDSPGQSEIDATAEPEDRNAGMVGVVTHLHGSVRAHAVLSRYQC